MSYHQSQSQGFSQQPFIIESSNLTNLQKRNQIIDQRNYNYNGFIQTSEGQEDLARKRSQPQSKANQQENIQIQGNLSHVTPAGITQSQTPAPNNFQSQSIFQSAVVNKTPAQSSIGFTNQVGIQNQPISQSQFPVQKPIQADINQQPQQNFQNESQYGLSQQLTFQRDINAQNRPQSANQNAQQALAFQQSSRIENNLFNERPASNINANNNFQNIPSQSKIPNDGLQSQRNPSQYKSNLPIDSYSSRVPAAPDQNKSQIQQQDQFAGNDMINQDYHNQGSQFPPSHQYYNSSLLQEFKPIEQNREEQQSILHQYAQYFEVCGHQLDSQIKDEQALHVLNTSMADFDLEVFQQIKEELKSQDIYTVREFLEIYIKAIAVLNDRMIQEESMIQSAKDKLNELIQLQEQARIEEYSNPNQQSTLYIQIQQAKSLDRPSNYITRIQFDYNQQTETKRSTFSSDPVFNEEFKLKITNPNSILTFSVIDASNDRVLGYVTQKLKQFYHQKKIEEWYILEDQGGALGDINKQINITIQWIHSERQYYENILRENDYFEPIIKEQEEKLSDTIELLRILKSPFERDLRELEEEQKEKRVRSKKAPKKHGVEEDEPSAMSDCWTSCMALFDTDDGEKKSVPQKASPKAQVEVAAKSDQHQHTQNLQKSQPDIESIIDIKNNLVYAFVVISAIICYFRPNFIDLCLAIVLVSNYFELNSQNCNRFCLALLFTLFIDILWMAVFTSSWFSYIPSSTVNMILFLIIEISSAILKVILCLAFQKIKSDLNEQNKQQHIAAAAVPNNAYMNV